MKKIEINLSVAEQVLSQEEFHILNVLSNKVATSQKVCDCPACLLEDQAAELLATAAKIREQQEEQVKSEMLSELMGDRALHLQVVEIDPADFLGFPKMQPGNPGLGKTGFKF